MPAGSDASSGSANASGEVARSAPARSQAAPQWNAIQSRAGAWRRIQPHRRIVIHQGQQHRRRGGSQRRGRRQTAAGLAACVPGRAIASSTARNMPARRRPDRRSRAGRTVAALMQRMFRMAKNCTLVAAAFAAISARRALLHLRQRLRSRFALQCQRRAPGPATSHRAPPPAPPGAHRARRRRRARPAPTRCAPCSGSPSSRPG